MTAKLWFSYAGTNEDWFDREYYNAVHIPKVLEAWVPYGLLEAQAFFPSSTDSGLVRTVAVCLAIFEDEAAIQNALVSRETIDVVADIANFTRLPLDRGRIIPF